MTEPLQVGQFAIVDGEPVDRGPNAGSFHGKGPTDDRADLFLVAEGTTPAGESFAGHVISALGQVFNTLDMSLTGSLARLFHDAHRNIVDWNRKSIAQHRVSIGLTAFGCRGGQAVIAQAGPSAVFHLHGADVRAYFTDEEHGRPIGAGEIAPQFTRIEFAPGDRLLIISTVALRHLDEELLSGIVALPGERVLPELFHRLQHVRHLTAMLVTSAARGAQHQAGDEEDFVIDATALAAVLPATTDEAEIEQAGPTYQPSLFIDGSARDAVVVARRQLEEVIPRRPIQVAGPVPGLVSEIPAPLARVSGESPLARIAAERRARAALSQAALVNGSGRPSWRANGHAAMDPVNGPMNQSSRRRHPRADSFSRGLVREEAPPPPPEVSFTEVPLVDELAAEHRARAATPALAAETIVGESSSTINSGGSLVRVRESMSGRWKGGGTLSRRSTINAQLPPTWLVIVVGLSILLTLVGVLTVPRMLDRQSSQHYAELMDGASQRLSIARVQQDPAAKRTALTEAQAMLLEAQGLKGAGPEVGDMLTQVKSAIDVMDAVRTPAAVDVVASLDQFGDRPVSASRLAVSDDSAYILDSGSNQVISVSLNSGDRKIVYAEDKGAKRGRPIAMAYLETGDTGPVLLVADASNQLWSLAAGALKQVPFNLPSGAKITDIATSGRDLYVLDASASVVYRFTQSDGGFAGTAAKALESPDLAAARRLTVDGDILTADANGTLHRFAVQLALTLSQAGIDNRLVAPEAPQSLTKNGDLFVLDAPNDRVVVFRRDGTFDRQYRDAGFRASSAFAVHNGIGYIFSDGKLRRVAFN